MPFTAHETKDWFGFEAPFHTVTDSENHVVGFFKWWSDSPHTSVSNAKLFAEALNVHEATGLTPSQLQARVAELEAELMELQGERNSAEMDDAQAAWELQQGGKV